MANTRAVTQKVSDGVADRIKDTFTKVMEVSGCPKSTRRRPYAKYKKAFKFVSGRNSAREFGLVLNTCSSCRSED